ncbi:hypothetical protein CsatA_022310 [Cannabis sativa]
MAQLPPKIPQNWANNSFHPHNQQPYWVDEFLDFTAARRGAHRRSASSDSIAFLESTTTEEFNANSTRNSAALIMMQSSFDKLDDEQLMSMFSDEFSGAGAGAGDGVVSSNPSTSNSDDRDSNNNDEKLSQKLKSEPEEVEEEGCSEGDEHAPPLNSSSNAVSSGDTVFDPKRVKRILANRQSAQRSRVRKLQYISELERSVTTLQSEVSALSPRVAFLDHQRLILNVDNTALKQRIAALAQDNIFKDAHQEALKNEIERLRQVYHHQNIKKMEIHNQQNAPSSARPLATTTAAAQNSDGSGGGDCSVNGA